MLAKEEISNLEKAGRELLSLALQPSQWVVLGPKEQPRHQRSVGPLQISASIDVTTHLSAFLHVAFRSPGLTPAQAADYLEAFLKNEIPLLPNTEWQVTVDDRKWIHFVRRYTGEPLSA